MQDDNNFNTFPSYNYGYGNRVWWAGTGGGGGGMDPGWYPRHHASIRRLIDRLPPSMINGGKTKLINLNSNKFVKAIVFTLLSFLLVISQSPAAFSQPNPTAHLPPFLEYFQGTGRCIKCIGMALLGLNFQLVSSLPLHIKA